MSIRFKSVTNQPSVLPSTPTHDPQYSGIQQESSDTVTTHSNTTSFISSNAQSSTLNTSHHIFAPLESSSTLLQNSPPKPPQHDPSITSIGSPEYDISAERRETNCKRMYQEAMQAQLKGDDLKALQLYNQLSKDPLLHSSRLSSQLLQLKHLVFKNLSDVQYQFAKRKEDELKYSMKTLNISDSNEDISNQIKGIHLLKYQSLLNLSISIDIDEDDVVMLNKHAKICLDCSDFRKDLLPLARMSLTKALKKIPDHWISIELMVQVLFVSGDLELCQDFITHKALTVDPDWTAAPLILNECHNILSSRSHDSIHSHSENDHEASNLKKRKLSSPSFRSSHSQSNENKLLTSPSLALRKIQIRKWIKQEEEEDETNLNQMEPDFRQNGINLHHEIFNIDGEDEDDVEEIVNERYYEQERAIELVDNMSRKYSKIRFNDTPYASNQVSLSKTDHPIPDDDDVGIAARVEPIKIGVNFDNSSILDLLFCLNDTLNNITQEDDITSISEDQQQQSTVAQDFIQALQSECYPISTPNVRSPHFKPSIFVPVTFYNTSASSTFESVTTTRPPSTTESKADFLALVEQIQSNNGTPLPKALSVVISELCGDYWWYPWSENTMETILNSLAAISLSYGPLESIFPNEALLDIHLWNAEYQLTHKNPPVASAVLHWIFAHSKNHDLFSHSYSNIIRNPESSTLWLTNYYQNYKKSSNEDNSDESNFQPQNITSNSESEFPSKELISHHQEASIQELKSEMKRIIASMTLKTVVNQLRQFWIVSQFHRSTFQYALSVSSLLSLIFIFECISSIHEGLDDEELKKREIKWKSGETWLDPKWIPKESYSSSSLSSIHAPTTSLSDPSSSFSTTKRPNSKTEKLDSLSTPISEFHPNQLQLYLKLNIPHMEGILSQISVENAKQLLSKVKAESSENFALSINEVTKSQLYDTQDCMETDLSSIGDPACLTLWPSLCAPKPSIDQPFLSHHMQSRDSHSFSEWNPFVSNMYPPSFDQAGGAGTFAAPATVGSTKSKGGNPHGRNQIQFPSNSEWQGEITPSSMRSFFRKRDYPNLYSSLSVLFSNLDLLISIDANYSIPQVISNCFSLFELDIHHPKDREKLLDVLERLMETTLNHLKKQFSISSSPASNNESDTTTVGSGMENQENIQPNIHSSTASPSDQPNRDSHRLFNIQLLDSISSHTEHVVNLIQFINIFMIVSGLTSSGESQKASTSSSNDNQINADDQPQQKSPQVSRALEKILPKKTLVATLLPYVTSPIILRQVLAIFKFDLLSILRDSTDESLSKNPSSNSTPSFIHEDHHSLKVLVHHHVQSILNVSESWVNEIQRTDAQNRRKNSGRFARHFVLTIHVMKLLPTQFTLKDFLKYLTNAHAQLAAIEACTASDSILLKTSLRFLHATEDTFSSLRCGSSNGPPLMVKRSQTSQRHQNESQETQITGSKSKSASRSRRSSSKGTHSSSQLMDHGTGNASSRQEQFNNGLPVMPKVNTSLPLFSLPSTSTRDNLTKSPLQGTSLPWSHVSIPTKDLPEPELTDFGVGQEFVASIFSTGTNPKKESSSSASSQHQVRSSCCWTFLHALGQTPPFSPATLKQHFSLYPSSVSSNSPHVEDQCSYLGYRCKVMDEDESEEGLGNDTGDSNMQQAAAAPKSDRSGSSSSNELHTLIQARDFLIHQNYACLLGVEIEMPIWYDAWDSSLLAPLFVPSQPTTTTTQAQPTLNIIDRTTRPHRTTNRYSPLWPSLSLVTPTTPSSSLPNQQQPHQNPSIPAEVPNSVSLSSEIQLQNGFVVSAAEKFSNLAYPAKSIFKDLLSGLSDSFLSQWTSIDQKYQHLSSQGHRQNGSKPKSKSLKHSKNNGLTFYDEILLKYSFISNSSIFDSEEEERCEDAFKIFEFLESHYLLKASAFKPFGTKHSELFTKIYTIFKYAHPIVIDLMTNKKENSFGNKLQQWLATPSSLELNELKSHNNLQMDQIDNDWAYRSKRNGGILGGNFPIFNNQVLPHRYSRIFNNLYYLRGYQCLMEKQSTIPYVLPMTPAEQAFVFSPFEIQIALQPFHLPSWIQIGIGHSLLFQNSLPMDQFTETEEPEKGANLSNPFFIPYIDESCQRYSFKHSRIKVNQRKSGEPEATSGASQNSMAFKLNSISRLNRFLRSQRALHACLSLILYFSIKYIGSTRLEVGTRQEDGRDVDLSSQSPIEVTKLVDSPVVIIPDSQEEEDKSSEPQTQQPKKRRRPTRQRSEVSAAPAQSSTLQSDVIDLVDSPSPSLQTSIPDTPRTSTRTTRSSSYSKLTIDRAAESMQDHSCITDPLGKPRFRPENAWITKKIPSSSTASSRLALQVIPSFYVKYVGLRVALHKPFENAIIHLGSKDLHVPELPSTSPFEARELYNLLERPLIQSVIHHHLSLLYFFAFEVLFHRKDSKMLMISTNNSCEVWKEDLPNSISNSNNNGVNQDFDRMDIDEGPTIPWNTSTQKVSMRIVEPLSISSEESSDQFYKTHITKEDYTDWLPNLIRDSICSGNENEDDRSACIQHAIFHLRTSMSVFEHGYEDSSSKSQSDSKQQPKRASKSRNTTTASLPSSASSSGLFMEFHNRLNWNLYYFMSKLMWIVLKPNLKALKLRKFPVPTTHRGEHHTHNLSSKHSHIHNSIDESSSLEYKLKHVLEASSLLLSLCQAASLAIPSSTITPSYHLHRIRLNLLDFICTPSIWDFASKEIRNEFLCLIDHPFFKMNIPVVKNSIFVDRTSNLPPYSHFLNIKPWTSPISRFCFSAELFYLGVLQLGQNPFSQNNNSSSSNTSKKGEADVSLPFNVSSPWLLQFGGSIASPSLTLPVELNCQNHFGNIKSELTNKSPKEQERFDENLEFAKERILDEILECLKYSNDASMSMNATFSSPHHASTLTLAKLQLGRHFTGITRLEDTGILLATLNAVACFDQPSSLSFYHSIEDITEKKSSGINTAKPLLVPQPKKFWSFAKNPDFNWVDSPSMLFSSYIKAMKLLCDGMIDFTHAILNQDDKQMLTTAHDDIENLDGDISQQDESLEHDLIQRNANSLIPDDDNQSNQTKRSNSRSKSSKSSQLISFDKYKSSLRIKIGLPHQYLSLQQQQVQTQPSNPQTQQQGQQQMNQIQTLPIPSPSLSELEKFQIIKTLIDSSLNSSVLASITRRKCIESSLLVWIENILQKIPSQDAHSIDTITLRVAIPYILEIISLMVEHWNALSREIEVQSKETSLESFELIVLDLMAFVGRIVMVIDRCNALLSKWDDSDAFVEKAKEMKMKLWSKHLKSVYQRFGTTKMEQLLPSPVKTISYQDSSSISISSMQYGCDPIASFINFCSAMEIPVS